MKERLEQGLAALGLTPPPGAVERLERYAHLLLEQNKVMNLTAITQPDQVADLHFLDCAGVALSAGLAGKKLIDVGTGAGFPGMVLKLLVPSLSVTLLDSLQKRLDWLAGLADDWGLSGLRVYHGRAEEAGQSPTLREQFDCATARAVADLRLLSELCLPLVKVGGRFLAMKGMDCQAELDAARPAIAALGGAVAQIRDYSIPHTAITHRVIVVDKLQPTPAPYPRRWAKLRKHPL